MTASEMFGVPVEGMPSDVRRRAKAINFGIIYGISAFGLANQLSRSSARKRATTSRSISSASPASRLHGQRPSSRRATRAMSRRSSAGESIIPEIRSTNPSVRAFNERAAINAPIQGSAADIIRRAMIKMEPALEAAKIDARMLLQVHDDIQMEPALAVDARSAKNWDEAH
jgi:DNA polymerase-1